MSAKGSSQLSFDFAGDGSKATVKKKTKAKVKESSAKEEKAAQNKI